MRSKVDIVYIKGVIYMKDMYEKEIDLTVRRERRGNKEEAQRCP